MYIEDQLKKLNREFGQTTLTSMNGGFVKVHF